MEDREFPFAIPRDVSPYELLSFPKSAAELGFEARAFHRLVKKNPDLPVVRLGPGSQRIMRKDLYAWIDRHRASFHELPKLQTGRPRRQSRKKSNPADAAN